MTVGQFIKAYRHRNNLTLTSFAEIIGVDVSTVLNWEDDMVQPEIKHLYEISSATGTPMHILTNKKALERYGVPHKRVVYNIGLHTLFEAVYDIKTFICFLDAISSAIKLITSRTNIAALLFLEHLPDSPEFDFFSDTIGVQNIIFEYDKQIITLDLQEENMIIKGRDIVSIKPCGYFSNEAYGFLFYKDNTDKPDFRLDVRIYY